MNGALVSRLKRGALRCTGVTSTLFKTLTAFARRKNRLHLILMAWRVFRTQGWRGLEQELLQFTRASVTYGQWIALHDTLRKEDVEAIRAHVSTLERSPLISVLIPTFNTPEKWLRRAIESVREQLYPHWEMCIADDASTAPHVRNILEEYARVDQRIRIVFRQLNGHISTASNTALEVATGEFVALLDHDDELPLHALYMVAVSLNEKPHLDLIYSDEDKIDEGGRRFDPYFKPDWDPVLLTGQNMVSHLGVYRTSLVRSLGGFRKGYEGSQDWDLVLRFSEAIPSSHIHHIPHILYHWRTLAGSTSVDISGKPYALQAGEKAVREHFERSGFPAAVSQKMDGYVPTYPQTPNPPPLVTILIPTRNGLDLLRRCIESLVEKTRYSNYEILVIDNQSDDAETMAYLDQIAGAGVAFVLKDDRPFNYSALNNSAAKVARGSYLCLMNNDIEVISEGWLDEMVGWAARPGIGAVGSKLYYPDDTIQHAGVILGMGLGIDVGGVAGHIYRKVARNSLGYMKRLALAQQFSAVTAACLVVRKDVYEEVGGLDEKNLAIAFNDVDFCLRLRERGYRNLWTPRAELYHHESATRGPDDTPERMLPFQREVEYVRARWGHMLACDPAHNPNLSLQSSWPGLATVPRVTKPWRLQRSRLPQSRITR
jgi:O-antigen biosynthesis protein